MKDQGYSDINRRSWNNRTDIHLTSSFYDLQGFLEGKSSLNPIELELLGDVKGRRILHLQCHFGLDSISLARLGAEVTGVDFSDRAIHHAREIAAKTSVNTRFVCCNVYDLPNQLDEPFDLVFTSYGTIGWLPDLHRWAQVVSHFLKPGGKFVFVEFHPVLWMFDDQFEGIRYSYFNTGPIRETESGTYADRSANISQEYVTWNHSLGEVMTSLIDNGLEVCSLKEYDYSPYDCFSGTKEFAPGKYRIGKLDNKLPMLYSVLAKKHLGAG